MADPTSMKHPISSLNGWQTETWLPLIMVIFCFKFTSIKNCCWFVFSKWNVHFVCQIFTWQISPAILTKSAAKMEHALIKNSDAFTMKTCMVYWLVVEMLHILKTVVSYIYFWACRELTWLKLSQRILRIVINILPVTIFWGFKDYYRRHGIRRFFLDSSIRCHPVWVQGVWCDHHGDGCFDFQGFLCSYHGGYFT